MKLRKWLVSLFVFLFCLSFGAYAGAAPDSVRIVWPRLADAASYELQFIDQPAATGETVAAAHILKTQTVTAPGAQIPWNFSRDTHHVWWRVRGLDVLQQPNSDYSAAQPVASGEVNPTAPLTLGDFSDPNSVLLYPAYSWVPVPGAAGYDVVVAHAEDGSRPADAASPVVTYHVDGGNSFDCYDWHSYNQPGVYAWQVRAVTKTGAPLGEWSKPVSFTVKVTGFTVAAFGDSITHGGGAISSPPGTTMYDWTQAVSVPVKNLGRSGDTTGALLDRFDQDVVPFHPQILVILAGINDLRDGASAGQVIANLRQLKQKALAQQMIPVFVTICPVNPPRVSLYIGQPMPDGWQKERRAVNRWILAQPNAVDAAALLQNAQGLLPDKLSSDGLHPDSQGKQLIGQAVSERIYQILNGGK